MTAEEHEASEVDLADSVEIDPVDVDDREFFSDERPEPLEDEEAEVADEPDYTGDLPKPAE